MNKLKLKCWIIFMILPFAVILAQEISSGKVVYEFNSSLNGISLPRTAYLYFAEDKVIFFHSRGKGFVMIDKFGNVGDHTLTVTTVNDNSGQASIDGYYQDETGNAYYFDYTENELSLREIIIVEPYLYKEPIPKIQWELIKDQKLIGNYVCYKAKGNFRGRNYVAWFCPEIPLPYGPWKLHGLPGLILEAEDEKKEIIFKANLVKYPIEKKEIALIAEPKDGKKISLEEAKTIWSNVQKKLITKMNSTQNRDNEPMGIKKLNLMEQFDEKE